MPTPVVLMKKQRPDYVGIGSQRKPLTAKFKYAGIVLRLARRVTKSRQEHLTDKLVH